MPFWMLPWKRQHQISGNSVLLIWVNLGVIFAYEVLPAGESRLKMTPVSGRKWVVLEATSMELQTLQ